jgi:hypothetical protein
MCRLLRDTKYAPHLACGEAYSDTSALYRELLYARSLRWYVPVAEFETGGLWRGPWGRGCMMEGE